MTTLLEAWSQIQEPGQAAGESVEEEMEYGREALRVSA